MEFLTKTDYEKFPVEFNFVSNLKLTDEAITAKTVTCINADTGVNTKTTIIDSEAISSPKITLVVKAGTVGDEHKITVKADTDGGNSYTKQLLLRIARTINDSFEKKPTEEFLISNDFEDDLESGDSLSTKAVTAIKRSDGTDATSTVIESSDIEGTKVFVGVQAGTNREDYRVTVKVTTANGYQYQKDIIMRVRN